jgi:methionyl-tRNA formyltransferase
MAGDAQSGVMVMRMAEGLDTGPVAMAERVPVGADMTAGELHDTLAPLGADLMVRALGALERGTLQLTPQSDEGVTYAAKIAKSETRIDWGQPWKAVHDHCRGLAPFPGAWFELPGAQPARIKVLRAMRGEGSGAPGTVLDENLTIACRDGAVRPLEIQRAGKQPMKAEDFLRGTPVAPGTVLR